MKEHVSCTLRDFARIIIGWNPEEHVSSETAWLNGVRGLAAFLVLMAHYSWDYLTFVSEAPFGALMLQDSVMKGAMPFRKGTRLWAPWRLPILHLFINSAGGQVSLFFVLSGFVLTWSSLGLARSKDFEKLYTSLGSSTFRRWSRLFLPCVVVNYIYALHENLQAGENVLLGFWSFLKEAASWINPFKSVSDEFMSPFQRHNAVVWTIPYEFSGSIYIFLLVLTLGRFSFSRRVTITGLLTILAFLSDKSWLWLFGAGMILADWARQAKLLDRNPVSTKSMWQSALWTLCLVFGLILLGWPKAFPEVYTRPGYDWIEALPLPLEWRNSTDSVGDIDGIGAILVVASACHLQLVRRFFETAFLQYLGKISFMLYLIHILLGGEVGRRIQKAAYAALCIDHGEAVAGIPICEINPLLHLAILVGLYLITVPCVFVAASTLERFVDRPITKLGKVVEDALLSTWSDHHAKSVGEASEGNYLFEPLEMESVESSRRESFASSGAELPLFDDSVRR